MIVKQSNLNPPFEHSLFRAFLLPIETNCEAISVVTFLRFSSLRVTTVYYLLRTRTDIGTVIWAHRSGLD
ncbi:hypothetical protein WN55_01304 [Dufourea novaeangliae]|uniref:Uncharacterized protein n=1 Tax=Dufourea novaeangliae TaxID=178035 RepID=A0A154PD61_DUFNO|nr:hypothetical protein WN55_01304 [Dufourea novaeangliae]